MFQKTPTIPAVRLCLLFVGQGVSSQLLLQCLPAALLPTIMVVDSYPSETVSPIKCSLL